ncbi:hypothetical protein [Caldalkalibacillus mannanilyticus]|uniref:hypothetical protein n=1 Tax=Caldalkalibacillus mannanilyticus TaxID=1418 RepID=UPI000A93CCC6
MKPTLESNSRSRGVNLGHLAYVLWNRLGMIFILVLLCAVLSFTAPNFLDSANLMNVLKQVRLLLS